MNWLKRHFYLLPVFLFLPALGNFFSADDWFHLRITQIDNFSQFLNFFSFSQNTNTASFYRPLSTQVFFYLFQAVFGLNSFWYYAFGLLLFAYTIYLVKKISGSDLAAFIYGVSVSNFTRVYFASAFQELFLVIFSLLTLINFKKKPKLSLIFFVFALLSKETAIILPILILLLNYKDLKNKQYFLPFIFYFLLSFIYLYFRLLHFGLAAGDSYLWDFSPVRSVNTLMWYTIWSFGAPELLVDYVGSGLRLIPRFFTDYSSWWSIIVLPLIALVSTFCMVFIRNFKKLNFQFWIFTSFFIFSLVPVLFLPSHKFTLELGLPLVGFAIALSMLLKNTKPPLFFFTFSLFLFYNLSMNILTYTRHYSISRSRISLNIYHYLVNNYPIYPSGKNFMFINDSIDRGHIWGQSKQISQSISGSDMFRVFYNNPNINVGYQDAGDIQNSDTITLSTKQFIYK